MALPSTVWPPAVAHASEGGSSEYALGYIAPQAGYLPDPGGYLAYNFYYYNGDASVSAGRQILGGHGSIDVNASFETTVPAHLFSLSYVFDHSLLGGNAGVGLLVPYLPIDLDVTASGSINLPENVIPLSGSRQFESSGIGDIIFTPMLGWHQTPLHYMALVNVYIPTGKYDANEVVNPGHNHWAVEPMFNATYLHEQYGIEVSEALGFTFNTKNSDTQYTTGIESHLDLAVIEHLSQYVYLGAVGYGYYQLTGDSGSGAVLGNFKGRVFAAGPVLGGMIPLWTQHLFLNARYYKEFGAENRLEGSAVYATAAVDF